MNKKSPLVECGMLGHFSAGFTLDTYAHATTAAQKEAAQTIGNVPSLQQTALRGGFDVLCIL